MSEFLNEQVPRMPPISMPMLEAAGEKILAELLPTALMEPTAIDFVQLVEHKLTRYGIFVCPASAMELGDRLAATDPTGTREINILLRDDLWHQLLEGGRIANRARATIAHELSHAVLHVPVMRRRMKRNSELLLNRVSRHQLRAYEDPEWQAWALAGCIIAPRRTLSMVPTLSVAELAEKYGVSEGMMLSHLKRLKLRRG